MHLILGQGLTTEWEEPPFCGAGVLQGEEKVTVWAWKVKAKGMNEMHREIIETHDLNQIGMAAAARHDSVF